MLLHFSDHFLKYVLSNHQGKVKLSLNISYSISKQNEYTSQLIKRKEERKTLQLLQQTIF